VLLEVRADNEVAQRLYTRRGFEEIGRRRGYYQPSGDDAVVMKRRRVRALGRKTGAGRA
jgi:[ribosomal protein S18]-alanine N-acetyltransferase